MSKLNKKTTKKTVINFKDNRFETQATNLTAIVLKFLNNIFSVMYDVLNLSHSYKAFWFSKEILLTFSL